jgi:thiamine biosynthesis lipoprotein
MDGRYATESVGLCLHHLAFRAMNCDMAAWVVAGDPRCAAECLEAVRDFMCTVEVRLSRFLPHSELSRLNASPGQAVPVSPLLWEVTRWALDSARCTGGLYDPTVLDALEAAGYDRTFQEVTADGRPPRPVAFSLQSWRDIRLDPVTRCVTLPADLRLDLGGIAKGWAAARAGELLSQLGPCLIDAGGDIAVRGHLPGLTGWPVGVADPQGMETDLALLLVKDRGVATSGIDYRRWRRGGVVQHHLIDPRTRLPAQTDLLAVTVIAPDVMRADLYAKVALLLGAASGYGYLMRQRDTAGLLLCCDGTQQTTPGWQRYVWHTSTTAPWPGAAEVAP